MRKLMTLVAAIAVLSAACGSGDGGGDISDSPLAQALSADIMNEADGDSPVTTQEEADCFAGRIVSGVGEDRLGELGVTVDSVGDIEDFDFTDGELDTIVDSLSSCVDLSSALAEQFESDFGAEGAKCVADKLGDDFIKEAMRAGFAGDDAEPSDEFFQEFLDIAADCNLPLN